MPTEEERVKAQMQRFKLLTALGAAADRLDFSNKYHDDRSWLNNFRQLRRLIEELSALPLPTKDAAAFWKEE